MSTHVNYFVSTIAPHLASEASKPSAFPIICNTSTALAPLLNFQCGECARRFSRRYALQEHLATHTGEKAYKCPAPNCGKRFTTTSNLARHRRVHGGELLPLACPALACSKTFTTQHKLQRHMRVHMHPPARRCSFADCAKTFSSAGNLNRHMRNQHLRFGHPLAIEADRLEQSLVCVNAGRFKKKSWTGSSSPTCVTVGVAVGVETLQQDTDRGHYVSDKELLEVLSCLLDDDKTDQAN
ncbi:hypothetical protein CCR75_003363 [Bremia lactucae]|uniref:C2H2-type domain-containing protein n=1 Tax=Bremia lactucae TaxID=4779 RepID=A0A976FIJ4_BRELC|nr:hypothetical protein CCR75_003363 [Bremia lactucae]